jgi:hypothetical protein
VLQPLNRKQSSGETLRRRKMSKDEMERRLQELEDKFEWTEAEKAEYADLEYEWSQLEMGE